MPTRASKNWLRRSQIMPRVLRDRNDCRKNVRSAAPREEAACVNAEPLPKRTARQRLNAVSPVRWSDASMAKSRFASSASSRLSMGATKGERKLSEAATVSTGSRQRNTAPRMRSLPMRGSTGRDARWKPRGVSRSSCAASRARSPRRDCSDASMASSVGGFSASLRNGAMAPKLRARTCRISSSSGTRSISGVWKSGRDAKRSFVTRWKHIPGFTRPARPLRCLPEDCGQKSVSRLARRVVGS
mmetsp:Transcript_22652/g.85839  ORF Transcript_22652/g.85839 Transcript_22652/m.85839 type:complete len:244 (-) Transcript_22652:212-943(-)